MATNMPTHNLSEVIDACVAYIDNNDIDIEDLMTYVKAPDFPTGGYIYGMSGVREAYMTGRGRVVMRAKAEIETSSTHDKIVVTEIPYGVNKAELIKSIADLTNEEDRGHFQCQRRVRPRRYAHRHRRETRCQRQCTC